VDSTYPAIVAVAARITAAAETPPERALRIHDLGRLEIASGLTPSFPDQRASDVLEAGVGCCSTKSTLLVALMRAREVPARRHFVDVAADQRLDTLRRAPR
jgi:transglutaminase-like putative cysteine protease